MRPLAASLLLFLVLAASANAEDRAWYGFHIKPETAGFVLNPIVQSVTIDKIAPNSPASREGMRVGDEIIEADGLKIVGSRGLSLVSLMKKHPGDTLRLTLRRPTGETYRVALVAIKKPGT